MGKREEGEREGGKGWKEREREGGREVLYLFSFNSTS